MADPVRKEGAGVGSTQIPVKREVQADAITKIQREKVQERKPAGS